MVGQYLKHPSRYDHEYKFDIEAQDVYIKLKERSNPNFPVNGHAGKFSEEQLKEIIEPLLHLWNNLQAELFNRYIITNTRDPIYENSINNFLSTNKGKIFSKLQVF